MKQLTLDKYINSATQKHVPTIQNPNNPDIQYVSTQTAFRLASSGACIILDARYPYEYEGGHITGAHNIISPSDSIPVISSSDKLPIIIHCEYSFRRGPALYRWIRNYNRTENMHNYPNLAYPDMYVMKEGTESFTRNFLVSATHQNTLK